MAACKQVGGVDSGLKTSDGSGNIVGLNEYKFDSAASALEKSVWTVKDWGGGLMIDYKKTAPMSIGGSEKQVNLSLRYGKGKLVSITLSSTNTELENIIHSGLAKEYGSKFPKKKNLLTGNSYQFEDADGDLVDLSTTDGLVGLVIQSHKR